MNMLPLARRFVTVAVRPLMVLLAPNAQGEMPNDKTQWA